jgi:hypothetical protein
MNQYSEKYVDQLEVQIAEQLIEIELLKANQIKELSDEEIMNIAFCSEVNTVAIENDWDGTVIDFARAILKKASEK